MVPRTQGSIPVAQWLLPWYLWWSEFSLVRTMVAQPMVVPGSGDIESLPEPLLVPSDPKGGVPRVWLDLRHRGLTCSIKSTPLFPTTPTLGWRLSWRRGEPWVGLGGFRATLTSSYNRRRGHNPGAVLQIQTQATPCHMT